MKKKEFAVGEVFQLGFKKLKVIERGECQDCALWFECFGIADFDSYEFVGECSSASRTDGKRVIFVEVKEEER